jgi:hypothetical protein
MRIKIVAVTCLLMVGLLSGCKLIESKLNPPVITENKEELYFSVKDFLDDQWKNRAHQPYTLTRIISLNDLSDTAFITWDSTFFNTIRAPFDAADIGKQEFLGKYNFSIAEDNISGAYNLTYEAKLPELTTRKLMITMDSYNQRLTGLYIETVEDNRLHYRSQKLLYLPDRSIQIQEFEKTDVSGAKNLRITYKFPEFN